MPEYEGIVKSLREGGRAEVVVQPEISGIVGAPGVSEKVRHRPSSSSRVNLEVLNPPRAVAGDRVIVRVEASALIMNAGVLIGIPFLALALGWAVSLLIPAGALPGAPLRLFCIFGTLPLGIAAGVILYRHSSKRNLPSIIRIIQTSTEMHCLI